MEKEDDFFWPGLADLMTALFAVMLVLFVLSFKLFKDKEVHLKTYASSYAKIKELEVALKRLDDSEYFDYQEDNKRYELKVPVFFDQWESEIKPEYRKKLIKAGKQLQGLLEAADQQSIDNELDVKYIVVVEGMAARDSDNTLRNQDRSFIQNTYLLSYKRALALVNLWKESGINFESDRFEIIISGSGIYGTGRYTRKEYEGKNKRFLIQILPKTGQLESGANESDL